MFFFKKRMLLKEKKKKKSKKWKLTKNQKKDQAECHLHFKREKNREKENK